MKPHDPRDFRPITDTIICARPRCGYYGAYPHGFLERARSLLGVGLGDAVLHVCSGKIRDYPFVGLGPNDRLMDADPECEPDILRDITTPEPWPRWAKLTVGFLGPNHTHQQYLPDTIWEDWPAILADPPYTEEDHAKYRVGPTVQLPSPDLILRKGLEVLRPGGHIGILHYVVPKPPPGVRFVAICPVFCGFNARIRAFTVFRKPL